MLTAPRATLLPADPLDPFAALISDAAVRLAEIRRQEEGQSVSPQYLEAAIRRLLKTEIPLWIEERIDSLPELYPDQEVNQALFGAVSPN